MIQRFEKWNIFAKVKNYDFNFPFFSFVNIEVKQALLRFVCKNDYEPEHQDTFVFQIYMPFSHD